MDRYPDDHTKKINWTKYKIIVPTRRDRDELIEAFQHIHNSDVDTDYVVVNQLVHEYLVEYSDNPNIDDNIIVNESLYDKL